MRRRDKAGKDKSLKINITKTKTLLVGKKHIQNQIVIRYEEIASSLQKRSAQEITKKELIRLRECLQVSTLSFWKSKTIPYQTELKILKTCIFSTALHAGETWTMKKTDAATEDY